jgi:hypothetical protein
MGDDISAIEQWATVFTDIPALTKKVTKALLLHKNAIMADIAADKAEWAAGEFFKAGATTADLLTIVVGPIEVTPALF